VGAEYHYSVLRRSGGQFSKPRLAYCADHSDSEEVADRLIRDVSFELVNVGLLCSTRYAQPFALLIVLFSHGCVNGPRLANRFSWFGN
jgi:predicted dinucleotide-binding enzyme